MGRTACGRLQSRWSWILAVENIIMDVGMIFKFLAIRLQEDQIPGHLDWVICSARLRTAQAGIRPKNFPGFQHIDLRHRDGGPLG